MLLTRPVGVVDEATRSTTKKQNNPSNPSKSGCKLIFLVPGRHHTRSKGSAYDAAFPCLDADLCIRIVGHICQPVGDLSEFDLPYKVMLQVVACATQFVNSLPASLSDADIHTAFDSRGDLSASSSINDVSAVNESVDVLQAADDATEEKDKKRKRDDHEDSSSKRVKKE